METRKYYLIANELELTYKCKINIIPYVITWEGLVTKYHKKHREYIGIASCTEAYIQSLVLKKTFESVPLIGDEVLKMIEGTRRS